MDLSRSIGLSKSKNSKEYEFYFNSKTKAMNKIVMPYSMNCSLSNVHLRMTIGIATSICKRFETRLIIDKFRLYEGILSRSFVSFSAHRLKINIYHSKRGRENHILTYHLVI